MAEVTANEVLEALRSVRDPDLGKDIVTLGFVKNLAIKDGEVRFDIELTTPACPVKDLLEVQARKCVEALPGVRRVSVSMTSNVPGGGVGNAPALEGVKTLIAVASGKGGVGKSTVTSNLAVALAQTGARVGLLDGDVYGPSIPAMFGITDPPEFSSRQRIKPVEKYGVGIMSLGFLLHDDSPVIWRGPMATRLIQQFLRDVDWGDLDYLLIDLPPGTGDIQLTLTQSAPLTGAVIVTTPQDVALQIARKGLRMFQQVNVPILGIVENMSTFVCPHCNEATPIFREGGGRKVSAELGLPLLGEIPLDPELVIGGDEGIPIVVRKPDAPAAQAYRSITGKMAAQLAKATILSAQVSAMPVEISSSDSQLTIKWDDGQQTTYPLRALRAACPCASCVDEWSGKRLISEEAIPSDIQLRGSTPVGRYAVAFQWSDGHSSGLYTFEYLRRLARQMQELD
ncbi:MAG: DUF971 domain-containing protein [Deltaproteobacteria bacterium]|nr:MAG: DUF971 domain-containing protein [Deltaproteobacteria bacterium]